MRNTRKATCIPLFFGVAMLAVHTQGATIDERLQNTVVKIYASIQRPDYSIPWQTGGTAQGTGSGFILRGKRILTNGHVVSDARFIEVEKNRDAKRYLASVSYIGHDCDLAILSVEDDSFFEGTKSVPFSDALPELNDEVSVVGYPMGGSRLSVTRGVVSRIDYSSYSHSGVDSHLVLQVDAAINPGNSGGPVFFKNKVVGLAFQGLFSGENIGYAIPVPVINRFLDDIADGKYHGYPELGVGAMHIRNPALRKDLVLPADKKGVVVYYIDPYGAANGPVKIRDVLLAIDGHPIDNDGTIEIDGNSVQFYELLERKQWGAAITLNVWRDGREVGLTVPLTHPYDPFSFRNIYDERPRYYILGGLVFCPLSKNYLATLGQNANTTSGQTLVYFTRYAKLDGLYLGREEFVVLASRLPHAVNTYHDAFIRGIVATVNGIRVRSLKHFKQLIEANNDDYHVIRFEDMEESLVIGVDAARDTTSAILARYGVFSREFLGSGAEGKEALQ